MGLFETHRRVARVLAVATVAACLGIASPAAANEVTVGEDTEDPCDWHASVWWNVPPEPGQRPVGFNVGLGCIHWNPPDTEPIRYYLEDLPIN